MLVKNVYIRVAANFLVAAINFIPLILIVKVFGSETWGKVIYYYSIAGVLSIFAELGFFTAYNKFLAADDDFRDIATFFVIRILLILLYTLTFCVSLFFKFKNSQFDNGLLKILFLAILLELVAQFFSATMTGKRDFFYLSAVEVISAAVSFVYIIFICFFKPNIYFLAYSQSVVPFVTIIGGFFYFKSRHLLKFYKPTFNDYKKYISYSLPLAFSSICERLMSYIDKLVLGNLLGPSEVGFYQIAQQCYGGADRFIKPVTTTIFTEIVHRIAKSKSYFHKGFKELVEVLNFVGGLMVIVIIFASKDIIQIFFGVENLRAAFILQFFSLTVIGRLFWRPYNNVILAIEKHKLIYSLIPLNIAAMIAFYYLLIPVKIGQLFYLGAAAIPITEFIIWILPIGFLRIIYLKKAFGNIHMGEIVLKIWLPLVIVVFAGIFIYRSILMLPAAILGFVLIEYFLKIVTVKRFQFLLEPIKQIFKAEI